MNEHESYIEKMKNLKPHKKEKEPSGLEALDNLLHLDSYGEDRKEYMQELGDVIEKELKRLEEIDNAMFLNNKKLKALEVISQNFRLVGNCLHARNPYAKDGWVFVKELETEEELNAWKEVSV